MKIIIKQKPNPIIVLLFIITIFPISKQAPAFIKYFPVFWQFQDMQWCLYVVADKCILWKAIVVCKVVILVFLLCSRVACKILYGSLGGAVVRALASHQCGLGSTPGVDAIHCMWVEFVVGSLPNCSKRIFSRYSGFPLSSKTNTSKFQFDLERTDTFKQVHMNSYVLHG